MAKLENCPFCEYKLTGPPDQHQCPECGNEYDDSMQVITQSGNFAIFLIVFLIVFSILMIFNPGVTLKRNFAGLLAVIGMIWAPIHAIRFFMYPRNKAVVSSDGISIIQKGKLKKKLLWEDIYEIHEGFMSSVSIIKNDKTVHPLTYTFFGSTRLVKEFIMVTNEHMINASNQEEVGRA